MKTKTTIWVIGMLFFLSVPGCKKDKRDPQPATQQTLLTKSMSTSSVTTYEYDNNNRVIKNKQTFPTNPSYNSSATYTYNSEGKLSEWRFTPDDPAASDFDQMKNTYSYNSQGLLMTIATVYIKDGVETPDKTETATYNADKVSIQLSNVATSGMAYLHRELFFDANKNLAMYKTYSSSGTLYQTTEYTYDDKPSSLTSLPTTDFYKNNNNYLSSKVVEDDTVISEVSYTYEYNADGYPTKRTITRSGQSTNYEYIKQ